MSRRVNLAYVLEGFVLGLCLVAMSPLAYSQEPFRGDILPKTTALRNAGLERQWFAAVPLGTGSERVVGINLSSKTLFVQTTLGNIYGFDAETGKPIWGGKPVNVGTPLSHSYPVSANDTTVFATGIGMVNAYHRPTGRPIFQRRTDDVPSCGPVSDANRVVIGQSSGMVDAYNLSNSYTAWKVKTTKPVTAQPILTERVVVIASQDGKVYVLENSNRFPLGLFRFVTGGPISASLGTYGEVHLPDPNRPSARTFTLLVPSEDHTLYAIDLFTGETRWKVATGAPIDQQPLQTENQIYVQNQAGTITELNLDALWTVFDGDGRPIKSFPDNKKPEADAYAQSLEVKTGETYPVNSKAVWTTQAEPGVLLSLGKKNLYFLSKSNSLFIVDRASGKILADSKTMLSQYGLDLRQLTLHWTNSVTDRIYLASPSGLVVCLHEQGLSEPYFLRSTKSVPFGYIPREEDEKKASGTAETAPTPDPGR